MVAVWLVCDAVAIRRADRYTIEHNDENQHYYCSLARKVWWRYTICCAIAAILFENACIPTGRRPTICDYCLSDYTVCPEKVIVCSPTPNYTKDHLLPLVETWPRSRGCQRKYRPCLADSECWTQKHELICAGGVGESRAGSVHLDALFHRAVSTRQETEGLKNYCSTYICDEEQTTTRGQQYD